MMPAQRLPDDPFARLHAERFRSAAAGSWSVRHRRSLGKRVLAQVLEGCQSRSSSSAIPEMDDRRPPLGDRAGLSSHAVSISAVRCSASAPLTATQLRATAGGDHDSGRRRETLAQGTR